MIGMNININTMQQGLALQCDQHGEAICGICTDQQCNAKDRLLCSICIRKTHTNCSRSATLSKQEMLEELKNLILHSNQQGNGQINKDVFRQLKQDIVNLLDNMEQQINELSEAQSLIQTINDTFSNTQSRFSWYKGYQILQNRNKGIQNSSIYDKLREVQEKIDYLLKLETDNINTPQIQIQNIEQIPNSKSTITLNFDQITNTLDAKSPIICMSCSSDGNFIASGCEDGVIRVFERQSNQFVAELKGHTQRIKGLSYSSDNKFIVSGSYDRSIRIWNTCEYKQVGSPLMGHNLSVLPICFSPNGYFFGSGSADNTIRIWDFQNRKSTKCFKGHRAAVTTIDYSPDGKLLASGSSDSSIKLWNTETGLELAYSLGGHVNLVFSVKFSRNGKNIVSGGMDKSIRIWDIETGDEINRFDGHTSYVWPVIYSPDNQYIISGSEDKSIRVWKISTGNQTQMSGHNGFVSSLCFSPDGKELISAGQDGLIIIQVYKQE